MRCDPTAHSAGRMQEGHLAIERMTAAREALERTEKELESLRKRLFEEKARTSERDHREKAASLCADRRERRCRFGPCWRCTGGRLERAAAAAAGAAHVALAVAVVAVVVVVAVALHHVDVLYRRTRVSFSTCSARSPLPLCHIVIFVDKGAQSDCNIGVRAAQHLVQRLHNMQVRIRELQQVQQTL